MGVFLTLNSRVSPHVALVRVFANVRRRHFGSQGVFLLFMQAHGLLSTELIFAVFCVTGLFFAPGAAVFCDFDGSSWPSKLIIFHFARKQCRGHKMVAQKGAGPPHQVFTANVRSVLRKFRSASSAATVLHCACTTPGSVLSGPGLVF